jgi:hypothetical protein
MCEAQEALGSSTVSDDPPYRNRGRSSQVNPRAGEMILGDFPLHIRMQCSSKSEVFHLIIFLFLGRVDADGGINTIFVIILP